jgi:hypothetical protein
MKIRGPSLADIKARTQKLLADHPTRLALGAISAIPYSDMLAKTAAVLRLKYDSPTPDTTFDQPFPTLDMNSDPLLCTAVARALLSAGGIEEVQRVSFAKYCSFAEYYVRRTVHGVSHQSAADLVS